MYESIPYMGSKRKLAHKIVNILFERHGNLPFYDLFGGGGAVSIAAQRKFTHVHYNELNKPVFELFNHITNKGFDKSWWQPISREQFFELKDNPTPLGGIAKTCWSFGNNGRDYLWGDCAELKILIHKYLVE